MSRQFSILFQKDEKRAEKHAKKAAKMAKKELQKAALISGLFARSRKSECSRLFSARSEFDASKARTANIWPKNAQKEPQ